MIASVPLLANGEGILVAIIMVVAVIAEVVAKWREAQAAGKKANLPRPNPARPKPARPRPAGGQDPLADEIGDFLRRATERRGQAGPRPAREGRASRPVRSPQPAQTEQPVQPILIDEPDGGVAQHVQQRMKNDFKRLSPELGTEVAEADDKMDDHLHQVFDHRLGRLGVMSGETAKPTAVNEPAAASAPATTVPLAQAVAGILANPATASQAILLHEILRRPEERWS